MKSIAVLVATATFCATAFAFPQTGYLVRQYQGQSVTGQYGTVCVYRFSNGEAHVFVGMNMCPMTWVSS